MGAPTANDPLITFCGVRFYGFIKCKHPRFNGIADWSFPPAGVLLDITNVSGLPVCRGRLWVTRPREKVRFVVNLNVRFATITHIQACLVREQVLGPKWVEPIAET